MARDTLGSINKLASLLYQQGKLAEAESLSTRAPRKYLSIASARKIAGSIPALIITSFCRVLARSSGQDLDKASVCTAFSTRTPPNKG